MPEIILVSLCSGLNTYIHCGFFLGGGEEHNQKTVKIMLTPTDSTSNKYLIYRFRLSEGFFSEGLQIA